MGSRFLGAKIALTSALRPVDEFEKKDNNDKNKSIRNDNNLPEYFALHGAPPDCASAMKLGGFCKVVEFIKRAKRHLDPTHSSGFTRRSFLAYSYAFAIHPC